MDQLTILERLQLMIDEYEKIIHHRFNQLEAQTVLLLDQYYTKYGESISEYTKYHRLESLQTQLDTLATAHYTEMTQDLQQASEETFSETYLLYAYLLYMFMGESDDEGVLPSLTSAAAKTSVVVAIVLLLLKAAKKPSVYFETELIDITVILTKHKNDYVYNVTEDVKRNLRTEAGYADASNKAKKRTHTARGYGVNFLYELLNDVINFAQDKIYAVTREQFGSKKLWCSMKDHKVREAHQILDGQFADKKGYFHYDGDKTKRVKGWKNPNLNWGCRCKILLLLDGMLPRTSKIHDYRDTSYNAKLNARIDELQKEGKTYLQSLQQAQKEIQAPKRKIKGYISYEDWLKKYGP